MERIDRNVTEGREGHEFRYRLAAGFAGRGSTVLDAACGTGYGSEMIAAVADRVIGVDVSVGVVEAATRSNLFFYEIDLSEPWTPWFDYDVFVSFETIEHLTDSDSLVERAKQAGRWIIMSCPIVPTKHVNRFHVRDLVAGEMAGLIVDDVWRHYQTVQQPSESSEICVFERRV